MRARQKVSRAGVELIKSFEGLRQTAARLPDGRWTLGYGHTFSAREGAKVTSEDADALLRFDLLPIVDAVNNLVLVPLNQNQFDALVSFCFNIGVDNFGASTVLKRINEGRMTEAALAMDSWRSAEFNGQTYVLAPLIRRRAAEKNLFLTPDDSTGTAPSLMVRPMPDTLSEHSAPTIPAELAASGTGGILSATPLSPAPLTAAPLAPVSVPYSSPAAVELPVTAGMPPVMPTTIMPVAEPVTPPQRQMIDLAQFTPRVPSTPFEDVPPAAQPFSAPPVAPVYAGPAYAAPTSAAPVETAVESLPGGMPSGVIRETPAAAPFYLSAHDDAAPMMSAEAQAALQRAQDEQRQQDFLREEAQRQAQAMAAARAAEEMRLAEQQRQEAVRQEQMRLELARQEQERADQARWEQARQEQARAEQERAAEEARREAVRLEAARAEAARLEAERLEREREEQVRLEQARAEQARTENERAEQQRLEQEKLDQSRLEQQRSDVAAQPVAAVADAEEAEKARKAEAAAALMRLYSPYGSGLGRPIGNLLPSGPSPLVVKGTPVSQPLYPEAPATPAAPFVQAAPEVKSEDKSGIVSGVVSGPDVQISEPPQTFGVSPTTLPPPVVTALNPYARPTPQVFEVPRPAAVDLSQSEPASMTAAAVTPAAASVTTPSWRDQLQRPLPEGYQAPQSAAVQRLPEQPSLPSAGQASRFDQPYEVEDDDWSLDGDRVALSSEEMEENTVSWWKMITSTFWWLVISVCGIVFLGMAAGSYWRSTQDLTVIRNGAAQFYTFMSVSAAAVGILLVSISVWLIMKRLGGLKD